MGPTSLTRPSSVLTSLSFSCSTDIISTSMSSDGSFGKGQGVLADLAPLLPSLPTERRESAKTSSRMLYDVWVHKFGSRLEQNQEESGSTSPAPPPASQSPSIVWWNTVASYLSRDDDSYQEKELLQIWQKFESTLVPSRLALSPSGDCIAQSHPSALTFRTQVDDYSSVRSNFALSPHDALPQRQRLSWNQDGTLLAFSTSDSQLFVFARTGKLLHRLDIKMHQGRETGGVVDLAWSKDSAIGTRASQLYVLTYGGILLRYFVYHSDAGESLMMPLSQALEIKDDPKRGPPSNLLTALSYQSVLTSMDISPNGKYLAIGGFGKPVFKPNSSAMESQQRQTSHSLTSSISFWRVLDVPPFFEYVAPVDLGDLDHPVEEGRKMRTVKKRCFGLWNSSSSTSPSSSTSKSSGSKSHGKGSGNRQGAEVKRPTALIRSVQFSPDSTHLLALDMAGTLTIWDVSKQLPVKRFRSEAVWQLTNGTALVPHFDPADRIIQAAHWWDTSSIFVLHNCGVCSVFGPVAQPTVLHPILANPRLAALNLSSASASSSLSSSSVTGSSPFRTAESSSSSRKSLDATPPLLASSSAPFLAPTTSNTAASSSSSSSSSSTAMEEKKHQLKIVTNKERSSEPEEPQEARNLLGPLPEKFAPSTVVSRVQNRRIFIFETESNPVKVPRKRLLYSKSGKEQQRRDIDPDLEIPYDYEMEGAKQPSCLKKAALSTWRFFIGHTDDKWGDTTIIKRKVTSRLLSLRNTTPEQLLVAKVSAGEFDFALSLATRYKLNPDLIYQTQWRGATVSKESIAAFLDKITDRDWVLHECIERIPRTMEAAIALLDYGIQNAVPSWLEPKSGRTPLSTDDIQTTSRKLSLASMDSPEGPSASDIKIILQRLILLSHWDRLQTYALINDNAHFDAREFLNFRTCSLINACATFAQNEDTKALAALWTYHSTTTLPYRLAVLCYLPETLPADSPSVQYLFPSIEESVDSSSSNEMPSSLDVAKADPWPTQQWREKDWAETDESLKALNLLRSEEAANGIIGAALHEYAHHCRTIFPRGLPQEDEVIRAAGSIRPSGEDPTQRMLMFHKLIESIPCEDIFSVRVEKCESLNLDYPFQPEFAEPIHRDLVAKDLTKWYKTRAIDVERLSGQAGNAMALIQVGIKNRVPKLEKVFGKLKLLCSLVYDCGKETQLAEFEHMDYLRRLHFLLEDATPANINSLLHERCEFYLHNARQTWSSYEQTGQPHFTTAFLAAWMCDVARASASSSASTLGSNMLPHVVQLFRASASLISKHQLKSSASQSSIVDPSTIAASPSTSSLTSLQSYEEQEGLSEAIIPTEFMLLTLGLHVAYLITPNSKETLNQLNSLVACLPKPPKTAATRTASAAIESPNAFLSLASSSLGSSASSGSLASLATEGPTPHQMAISALQHRVELLGNHLRAAEILLRHDLVKPLELFLTTWRADEPAAISMLFERLLQRDIRAQPPLPDSKWRDTLNDLHQLRELLNNARVLQASAYPASLSVSGTASPLKESPADHLATPLKIPRSHSPFGLPSPATPGLATPGSSGHLGTSSPLRPGSPLPGNAAAQSALGLSVDSTYELFCQALLRAGKFSLAKHYLTSLRSSEALIIAVAQEYFNSCSSATDRDMQLARDCLALISSPSSQAKEEQKLIDAVLQMSKLEDQFKLSMTDALPIQVRRSRDRMSYLRQLLESPPLAGSSGTGPGAAGGADLSLAPTSPRGGGVSSSQASALQNEVYLQLDELLDLGRLLGCASSDSERQEIKLLAANRAFKCKDFGYAAKLCFELVDAPSATSKAVWELAYRLSLVEKVDIHTRLKFLAFSMRHAPFEALQSMVGLWRGLEMRAKCAEIGVHVEMPRGTPAQLHLTERTPTPSNISTFAPSTPGLVVSKSQPQLSSSMSDISSASSMPQFRLDARKVRNAQLIFINTCLSKLMEMNASKWLHKMQQNAFSLAPSEPSLYGFYQPTPHAHPYKKSDGQILVDPVMGPLATYGDNAVENEILMRIKALILRGGSLDSAVGRASTLIEISHLAINSSDANLFLAVLLDPEVTPHMARRLFEELSGISSQAEISTDTSTPPPSATASPVDHTVSSAVLQLASYYFAVLVLQLQPTLENQPSNEPTADPALFDSNIGAIVKRAKKAAQKFKAPSASIEPKHQALMSNMTELIAHFDHFTTRATEIPAPPVFSKSNGANGRSSAVTSVLELARNTDIDSLTQALQKLTPDDDVDEFELMEAHFLSLVASDLSLKPFLQKYGDEMVRSNTFRFEATLDALWQKMSKETRFPRLSLVLHLQQACAQQHAESLEIMSPAPAATSSSDSSETIDAQNSYLNRFPPKEHYASTEFVERLKKQSKAIEDLSKALRAAVTSSSNSNAKIPTLAWKIFLDGDVAGSLRLIEQALTMDNVEILATTSKQLNALLMTSVPQEKDSLQNGAEEPLITSSLIYITLARSILKPWEGNKKYKDEALREELSWFARHLYSNLESRLSSFVDQFLVSRTLDPSLRLHMCTQILLYLHELYNGEEDELVILLKRLERHLDAILTLTASWSTSASLQSPSLKSHLDYYLNLLDLTFTATHQDSEIALICSRMISNGLPIAVAIEVIETYAIQRTMQGQHDITTVANHVIVDALKTITEVLSVASPKDEENSLTEPVGQLEWPPSNPPTAHAMLRALAQAVTRSGTTMFYKDVVNTLRQILQPGASSTETAQLLVLRVLQDYPVLYDTRRDLLAHDEKMLESFTIKSILLDSSGDTPRKPSKESHQSPQIPASPSSEVKEDKHSAIDKKAAADTLDEKLEIVRKLASKKSFGKAFQLLLIWSIKAEKDVASAAAAQADSAESSGSKTSKAFQISASTEVAEGEEGWGFDDEDPTSAPVAPSTSPPVVTTLSSGWKILLEAIIASEDSKTLITMRERIKPSWIEGESEILQRATAFSPMVGWKYGLCSRVASVTSTTVKALKKHLAAATRNSEQDSDESATVVSGFSAFFRGLLPTSSRRPDGSELLRYGTDYDAQLVYFLVKYGAFVEFVDDASLWPKIQELILFLLKSANSGTKSVPPPSIGSSDYQHVKELAETAATEGEAAITAHSIISTLVAHAQLTPAAQIHSELSGILPGPTRTLERFISMVPTLLSQYVNTAKHNIAQRAAAESELLPGSFGSAGTSLPAMPWTACLQLCQDAQQSFAKLKL